MNKTFLSDYAKSVILTQAARARFIKSGAIKLAESPTNPDYGKTMREKYKAAGLRSDGKPFQKKFNFTNHIREHLKSAGSFAVVDIPRPLGVSRKSITSCVNQMKKRCELIVVGIKNNGLPGRQNHMAKIYAANPNWKN